MRRLQMHAKATFQPVLLLIVTVTLVGVSAPAPAAHEVLGSAALTPNLHDGLSYAADACSTLERGACVAAAARAEVRSLAARMHDAPFGPAGPGAWLAFAAEAQGVSMAAAALLASAPALDEALFALYAQLGVPVDADLAADVRAQVAALTPEQAQGLARLVHAMVGAHILVDEALADIDVGLVTADPVRVARLATFVGSAPPDSVPPALQTEWDAYARELARVDLAQLAEAASLVTDALPAALDDIAGARLALPFVLVGAPGDSTHTADMALLIDESGNDLYFNNAGAGLFSGVGIGVAIDRGAGTDRYERATSAQGMGLAGVGLLYDEGGADTYWVTQFGQGSGNIGVGILYDAGDAADVYHSPNPLANIATKASALAGIGILVDEGGSDRLKADGLDGFVYGAAGGSAILANRGDGDDTYVTHSIDITLEPLGFLGNFSGPVQVSAEVGASAILYEEGGDDMYDCGARIRQGCQGAGGAGSLGLLLDEGGDDSYVMGASFSELLGVVPIFTMGQGSAYGPSAPGGVGVLYDADGADTYTAEKWAQGYGSVGVGVLLDEGGDDDAYTSDATLVGSRDDGGAWVAGSGVGRDV